MVLIGQNAPQVKSPPETPPALSAFVTHKPVNKAGSERQEKICCEESSVSHVFHFEDVFPGVRGRRNGKIELYGGFIPQGYS